jgi:predicted  nucleic acid-binding Zn ribbon protein
MEDVDSPLAKNGRGVAESLELRVKRPVYYFLNRITETKTERKRRCPSCRGAWLLKEPWHGKFDFRCRKYRLISNVAWGMR